MLSYIENQGLLLANFIEKDPGKIVTPIAFLIGMILNFVFQALYGVMPAHSFGISIIVLTIVIRTLMLPLGFKQQKSTLSMQKLQPKIQAIEEKYGDTEDQELLQKKAVEMQALYTENDVSMLGGCLPLLITFPLFLALNTVMRSSYLHIPLFNDMYTAIADVLHQIPDYAELIKPIAEPMVPNKMVLDFSQVPDMMKLINKFTPDDWETIIAGAGELAGTLEALVLEKQNMESFLGINLLVNPSFSLPSIIIPITSGLTQFLTFHFMQQPEGTGDPNAESTQKIMKFVMPVFMVYMTTKVSAGVGLYWTVSNVYGLLQQIFIKKYYEKHGVGKKKKKKEKA